MARTKLEIVVPSNGLDRKQLARFVERIEHVSAERAELTADISSIYREAKQAGFDGRYVRRVISLRKMSRAERDADRDTLEMYMHALGMLSDTPLGRAALERDGLTA